MIIAVSACLLGSNCRYDGSSKPCEEVIALKDRHTVVPICPEVLAGLMIPHAANEIASVKPLRVVDANGVDNTAAFIDGARKAVRLAQAKGCELAILKGKSPSCGVGRIYDGSFNGVLVPGDGVAAGMLKEAGIPVCDENNLPPGL